ncbi:myeloid cell nuclear differentiation antigen-like protein [Anopheles sinensis]|uniref:Myeloid cell nuclear differentiation antigen-like protein n=1 Tax=Anopheles sinensis TaxID=74873 RepID=A0A084WPL4_ANOSI|nr:myeloid cell nuclear differentiation antigen-like protein [Anopheles sinensis]
MLVGHRSSSSSSSPRTCSSNPPKRPAPTLRPRDYERVSLPRRWPQASSVGSVQSPTEIRCPALTPALTTEWFLHDVEASRATWSSKRTLSGIEAL